MGDAVPAATLRAFCEGSAAMLGWLESHGVPFAGSLCPDKTSYPTNRHYLYYSGSELSARRPVAPPAPRGHRTHGRGPSAACSTRGCRRPSAAPASACSPRPPLAAGHRPGGRVTGVECRSLRGAPAWVRLTHRVLHRWSVKPYLYVPKAGRILHRPVGWLERRYARPLRIGAARGVVMAAGGFAANRPMLRSHAPNARGGLPLATPGDDGSGIRLGTEAGGATASSTASPSGASSARRRPAPRRARRPRRPNGFATSPATAPPSATAIIRHGGRAWLLSGPQNPVRGPPAGARLTLWFQRLGLVPAEHRPRCAPTVAAVAARAGVDPDGLAATLAAYNAAAQAARPGGQARRRPVPQDQPPYWLIDCSVRPRLFYPAPVLTLGGLTVAPVPRPVLRADGTPVEGLYAAGRTAAGSYVSGLSTWPTASSPAAAPADTPRHGNQRV